MKSEQLRLDILHQSFKTKQMTLKSRSIFVGLLFLSELFSNQLHAAAGDFGFHLPINFRTRSEIVAGGTAATTQYLDVVPSLSYQYSDLFYFGVNYRYTNESGSGGFKMTGGAYGPSVGVSYSNFVFSLAYYLNGDITKSNNGSADLKYSSGTGPEISAGYLFAVAPSFAWGPEFMYSDITYTSTQVSGVTTAATYELSGIEPYIALFFYF